MTEIAQILEVLCSIDRRLEKIETLLAPVINSAHTHPGIPEPVKFDWGINPPDHDPTKSGSITWTHGR